MRLFILFFLFAQVISAQDSFNVLGKITPSVDTEKVFLYYPSGSGYKVDSAIVVNNEFNIAGSIQYPVLANLELKDKENVSVGSANFYIENKTIVINYSPQKVDVVNSTTEDLKNEFLQSLLPLKQKADSLNNLYQKKSIEQAVTTQFQDSIDAQFEKLKILNAAAIETFIKTHPNDFFSLYLLDTLIENEPNSSNSSMLFAMMAEELKTSGLGLNINEKLDKLRSVSLGNTAPEFSLTDINGNAFNLSDFRGKYVLLLFWSSDCSHCLYELPNIEKIYTLLKNENLVIVSIAQDNISRKAEWENLVKSKKLQWINAFDERIDGKKKVAGQYNITKIPSDFILNPKGQIIAKDVYGNDLFNQLSMILNMSKKSK